MRKKLINNSELMHQKIRTLEILRLFFRLSGLSIVHLNIPDSYEINPRFTFHEIVLEKES